jgi:hypothetical protein
MNGHLNDGEVRKALEPAQYVASVSKEVIGQARTRLGQSYSSGLDPKRALSLYLESRNLPQDRTRLLMEHADRLMSETPP